MIILLCGCCNGVAGLCLLALLCLKVCVVSVFGCLAVIGYMKMAVLDTCLTGELVSRLYVFRPNVRSPQLFSITHEELKKSVL
jgi:hypothetical protein